MIRTKRGLNERNWVENTNVLLPLRESYALSLGVLFNSIFAFATMALLYIWQRRKKNSIENNPKKVYSN